MFNFVPPGARTQYPYKNLNIIKPIFPEIAKASLIENPVIEKITKEKIADAVNILLKMAPKKIKDILGFSGEGSELTMRKLIESVGADDQCERSGIIFKTGTVCWLCGCVILKDEKKACEHIIPALRAVMLKGLITNKQINNKVVNQVGDIENYNMMTSNNYLWAHENCNGSSGKSGMVLFNYEEERFIPDYGQCGLLQSKIRKLVNRKCYDSKDKIDYTGKGNIVKSPYETYVVEMGYQCQSINKEFESFEGNIIAFTKYALNRTKLFLTSIGVEALLTEEEKTKRGEELLKNNYEELNKLYVYLQNDIKLAEKYLKSTLTNKILQTPEQKRAYYSIAIELYLLYFNLETEENNTVKENILNSLNSDSGMYLTENVPLEVMLTIIYILTQCVLFISSGGEKKLLNTNKFLTLGERIGIRKKIERMRPNTQISNEIKNLLFINDQGERDDNRFNNHLCDYISIFIVQHIIYDITKSNGKETNINKEIAEVTPIPISISLNDIEIIKNKLTDVPSYIEPYYDEIVNGDIFKNLKTMFFSLGYDIEICNSKIKEEVFKRFKESGVENEMEGYNEYQMGIITDFTDYYNKDGNWIDVYESDECKGNIGICINNYLNVKNYENPEETRQFISDYIRNATEDKPLNKTQLSPISKEENKNYYSSINLPPSPSSQIKPPLPPSSSQEYQPTDMEVAEFNSLKRNREGILSPVRESPAIKRARITSKNQISRGNILFGGKPKATRKTRKKGRSRRRRV